MVEVGSTIGNYEVLQKIGQGAMGAVFLARHPVIGKRVALKVIHPELSTNEEVISRFFNEARAVTQIGHAHIVDVQDFGQTPGGDSFIVMELLEGIGLGDLIKRDGPLPIERAVHIARQLTDGLKAAHARGIVHRDLKPDNIFLVPRGDDPDFVKILDFGLAKLTGPGAMSHKTRTGAVLGTPHYMAPEAAEDARKADHRVDVYALGCILFQMVVGRVPFPGDGFGEVLVRHVREPPPLPSRLRADVPPWLEKLILHALAKKVEFRLASMDEFGRALRDPVAWEQAFDDRDLSEEELAATSVKAKRPTPAPSAEPVRAAPVRAAKISPDAKTVSGDSGEAQIFPGETTAELPEPAADTVRPAASLARRRTQSALGLGASILGALAILAVGVGVARHVLYSDVTLAVTTEPPGAEIVLGAHAIGTSPAHLKVPRGHTPITILVQKAGYVSVRRSLEPSRDLALDVTLPAEPPRPKVEPEPAAVDDEALAPPAPPKPVVVATPEPTPPAAARPAAPKRARKPKEAFKTDGLLLAPTF